MSKTYSVLVNITETRQVRIRVRAPGEDEAKDAAVDFAERKPLSCLAIANPHKYEITAYETNRLPGDTGRVDVEV